jgi:hypothetical protein
VLGIGETEGAADTEGRIESFFDGGQEGWVLGIGETEGAADTEGRIEGDSEGREEGNIASRSTPTPTPTPTATTLAVAMERKKARRRPQVAPQLRRKTIRSTLRLRQNGTGFSGSTISPINKSFSETRVADTRNPDFSDPRVASVRRDGSDGSNTGVRL